MLSIALKKTAGQRLLGASCAQEVLARFMPAIKELSRGSIVVLDFTGVEAVNGSFVRSSGLYLHVCGRKSTEDGSLRVQLGLHDAPPPLDLYPVFYAMNSDVQVEVDEVFRLRNLPFVSAVRLAEDRVIEARVCGHLEPASGETLKALIDAGGSATAAQLSTSSGPGRTAWNNRLNELVALRLSMKARSGREWVYRLIADRVEIWAKNS